MSSALAIEAMVSYSRNHTSLHISFPEPLKGSQIEEILTDAATKLNWTATKKVYAYKTSAYGSTASDYYIKLEKKPQSLKEKLFGQKRIEFGILEADEMYRGIDRVVAVNSKSMLHPFAQQFSLLAQKYFNNGQIVSVQFSEAVLPPLPGITVQSPVNTGKKSEIKPYVPVKRCEYCGLTSNGERCKHCGAYYL